jgi:hypothetical protein
MNTRIKVLPFIVGIIIGIIIFDAVNPWKVAFLFALLGGCEAFIIYDLINTLEEKESNEIEDLNN